MIEAELKARVGNPRRVLDRLEQLAVGRDEVYLDTYYDDADRTLTRGDRELRVRTVSGVETVSYLTYKGARVDEASGSKPEHETRVADVEAVHALLSGLGYTPVIRFEKRCRNFAFGRQGRRMLATLVTVPELDETFVEVETLVERTDEVPAALDVVRAVLGGLGVDSDAVTNELYTDAVAAGRMVGPGG